MGRLEPLTDSEGRPRRRTWRDVVRECVVGLLLFLLLLFLACSGCRAPDEAPHPAAVHAWGTLRSVLREGRDAGRVRVLDVTTPDAVGVGALAGLAGEITVADGRALVATAEGDALRVRAATSADRAALLVLADVPDWEDYALGSVASLDALEDAIATRVAARGDDPRTPVAVRVRGRATRLDLHVIAGACPIADPDGPPPLRWSGAADSVLLVGFFAEDSAGRFTHHGRRTHLHAVAGAVTGHLDHATLEDVVLSLPARAR